MITLTMSADRCSLIHVDHLINSTQAAQNSNLDPTDRPIHICIHIYVLHETCTRCCMASCALLAAGHFNSVQLLQEIMGCHALRVIWSTHELRKRKQKEEEKNLICEI